MVLDMFGLRDRGALSATASIELYWNVISVLQTLITIGDGPLLRAQDVLIDQPRCRRGGGSAAGKALAVALFNASAFESRLPGFYECPVPTPTLEELRKFT
jgi:hypothetical protein